MVLAALDIIWRGGNPFGTCPHCGSKNFYVIDDYCDWLYVCEDCDKYVYGSEIEEIRNKNDQKK
jgi:DNA-directed RNA polymerase subunit RPC12/RpoP